MTTLSLVIPAYNEETGITEIVWRVLAVGSELRKINVELLELLVVDDGSKDKTAQITERISEDCTNLRLIQHPTNKGYGAALKTGFSQAKGELIGFLDADGTYPPEYFPALCQEAMNGSDLVVGSRMSGADSQMPRTRRVGNYFFANLLSFLGRQRITDSASGMRVFKREVLSRVYPLPDGLNLTPVMSTRAMHEGIKMSEVPIPYSERVGRSKLSVVRDGTTFLQSIVWTVLAYNPVRVLGAIGLGGVVVAIPIGLAVVAARLMGVTELGPWGVLALFLALVSAVVGISIFALGSTFNYLVSLFYKQPIRQGLFGRPVLKTPMEGYFGVFGLVALVTGTALASVSAVLGVNGWDVARLWFYMLGSAMLVLIGFQLVIYWILMKVLDELSRREILSEQDLATFETEKVLS
jgi:glycosyltransferase involved in cell wall biosynthesis